MAAHFKMFGHPTHSLFPQLLSKQVNLLGSLTIGQERLQNLVHGAADNAISVIHSLKLPLVYFC